MFGEVAVRAGYFGCCYVFRGSGSDVFAGTYFWLTLVLDTSLYLHYPFSQDYSVDLIRRM